VSALAQIRMENPARKRRGKSSRQGTHSKKNVGELLIFGNPKRGKNASGKGFGNHKPGCACKFCDRARKLQNGELKPPPLPYRKKRNSKKLDAQRGARERAARIRAARVNPKKKQKRATLRRRRTDRNPSETKQAVRLFQGFHGHDPKEIAEKHVSAAVRLDYSALGDLDYLIVETPLGKEATFTFYDDGVKLAAAPPPPGETKSRQLYCIGGNQNILPLLDGASQAKDFIDLGYGLEVQYMARKVHTEFRPTSHFHNFGEETGDLPRLMFDKIRKQIFFIGGNYRIDVTMRAPGTPLGKVSPGIEN